MRVVALMFACFAFGCFGRRAQNTQVVGLRKSGEIGSRHRMHIGETRRGKPSGRIGRSLGAGALAMFLMSSRSDLGGRGFMRGPRQHHDRREIITSLRGGSTRGPRLWFSRILKRDRADRSAARIRGGGDSDASWSLECEVEDLELRIDGKPVAPSDIVARGGSSFALEVGPNLVEFKDMESEGVEISLNRSPEKHMAFGKVELHFSKHAVCLGQQCVMWPQGIPAEGWGIASGGDEESTEDRDAFMERLRENIGESDFNTLKSYLTDETGELQGDAKEADNLHSDQVTEIHSQRELEYLIEAAGDKLVVIDFWADWCVPCKQFAPFFNEQAEDPGNSDVVFAKLNIQETNELLKFAREDWHVESLPSFVFLKHGKIVNRLAAANTAEFLSLLTDSKNTVATKIEEKSEPRPTEYDLVVIGGGSGGLAAAKEAAKHGARVALFDFVKPSPQGTQWGFGGTCVNVGCIPKKLMHYAALCGEACRDATALGWKLPATLGHDWGKLVSAVQAHVKKLNFFYENGVKAPKRDADGNLPHEGIWYYNAPARFEGPNEISWKDSFGNNGVVQGAKSIIAVGCRPAIPDVPGKELAITSDDLFSLRQPPGKVLCVGAGYIALEVAGFLTNLGSETHVAVRSTPLRVGFDKDATSLAVELMKLQGTQFWSGWNVKSLEKEDGKIKVTLQRNNEERTELFDTVIYATGRYADIAGLNIEAAGVTAKNGKVVVDEGDRTSAGNVYAIGDCASCGNAANLELTPVAIQSGEMLVRRLFNGATDLMDYQDVATTVFTPFEIGSIGLSEEDAIAKYGEDNIETYIKVYESLEIGAVHRKTEAPYFEKEWDAIEKRHVESDRHTSDFPGNAMAKLVCLKSENERVVGFHYVGPNAGEITQGFAVAMKLGASKKDFDATVGGGKLLMYFRHR